MTIPAVEIIGISKRFGATTALESVDFTIAEGEFVSLLGASGCGKTTLLRIIAGFETPSAGRIRINGEDVTTAPPERRPTNLVFQRGALFPHMSVRENIGYGLKLKGQAPTRIAARVDELLALVRLEGFGDRLPNQLSGGQSQRVALARALAGEPRVLLLDEPLSALDLKLREQMQLELRAIQRQLGATFIFVTHDQTEALVMSDRIAVMNAGRIVQSGTPQDIYRRPASIFVSDFIGQTNLLRGTIAALDTDRTTIEMGAVRLSGPPAPGFAVGRAAVLSVRPEAVRLRRAGEAAGPDDIEGRVADIIYLGNAVRAGVEIAGSRLIWADLRDEEAEGLATGDTASIYWSPAAAIILPGDSA